MTGFSLLKNTNAYKIFLSDKKNGTLSHAYLIACEDGAFLEKYLKIFAKVLVCNGEEPCNACRTCNLIENKNFTDVVFYPKGKKIVVSDIDELIEKSYYKPLESDKKVFVLSDCAQMNIQAQNKLLKTLEEPPQNTYLLLGTTSLYPLLPTVLSRSKKLEIPPFTENELINVLSGEFNDLERLESCVRMSGGKLGEVLLRYNSDLNNDAEELAVIALTQLKSSADVLKFSSKITKDVYKDFISALGKIVQVCIERALSNKEIQSSTLKKKVNDVLSVTTVGALVYVSDKVRIAEKDAYFNGNLTAVVDGLLFGIVEGKYKWSK